MKPPSNPKVKISEITGPYQLFGLVLLVVEGLLGYWFFQAGSGLERGFVGLVMVAIVFGVFYTVIKIKHEDATVSLSNAPISIKPPVREASQAEIASPAAEVMTGPDRFYLINQPPQGWTVQEMTFSDWVSEAIGIKDPATKKKLFPSTDQSREILVFDRTHYGRRAADPDGAGNSGPDSVVHHPHRPGPASIFYRAVSGT